MSKISDRLIDILEAHSDQNIEITEMTKRFSMDIIWNCAFGVNTDIQHTQKNPFYEKCEAVEEYFAEFSILMQLASMFK